MAERGRWYEPKEASTKLTVVRDRFAFLKAEDEERLSVITELQGLTDETRSAVAEFEGSNLADFDDQLRDEEWDVRDRLDYYSVYQTRVENLSIADGAWFTPIQVESFCGETGTDVVGNSIDGANNTNWRHTVNHTHSVVYQIRGYPKKISKIRFRYGGALNREELNNITVRAAKNLQNIDDAANLLESGINPTWPAGPAVWVAHTLASKKNNARFIKLEFDTANGSNDMQVREFAVWVETRLVEDTF